jgi:putative ABC transport system permease protein
MKLQMAFRNVARNRRRSAMTIGVIAFGVAALIVTGGFVQDLYRQLGETVVYSQSGHLQVAREELFSYGSRSPEKHRIAQVPSVKAELAKLPGVRVVSGRLAFAGLLSNGNRDVPVLGEGIEPDGELSMMRSITLLHGGPLSSQDRSGAWLGEGLAASLGVRPGDALTLVASTVDGAMNTIDVRVDGVFRSFSQDYDARAIKINLSTAQDLLATEDANTIVLLLDDTESVPGVAAEALALVKKRGLAIRTWEELNDFYRNTVLLYDRQFTVLSLVILLMVALGVNNAVNMGVLERLSEFGTIRALGNRNGRVFALVMTEVGVLALVGACLGVAGGLATGIVVSAVGIDMPPPPNSNVGFVARIEAKPFVVLQAFGVGLVSTILAGVLPAMKVARIPIVRALGEVR